MDADLPGGAGLGEKRRRAAPAGQGLDGDPATRPLLPAPTGIYVSDRLRRCAEEQAARALRLARYRRSITNAITQTWPADPFRRTEREWQALRAALPTGVGAAEIRNRTRQIRAHLTEYRTLPQDLPDLETPPTTSRQALLAAADKQLFTMQRTGHDTAVLRLQLPLTAAPATRRDWAWHVIVVRLPPTIPAEVVKLCAPTLRVSGHRLRVDLPLPDATARDVFDRA